LSDVLNPMKQFLKLKILFAVGFFFLYAAPVLSQACTTLGQTPATAFPVCGTTTFRQTSVPLCNTNALFVPGCSGGGATYENKNPFFYKFTCYTAGTLGFLITPLAADEDYDWQLYDITGRNPNDIFTVNSLVVAGNWAGTYGPTGAGPSGVSGIECGSDPADNRPTFAAMPNLIAGHEYLLLISHFTNTQSGYDLSFGGGSAVITDPLQPRMVKVVPDCDGRKVTLSFNKKMQCNSLTTSGISEFSIDIQSALVVSAVPDSCSFGFDFDEVLITLPAPLTSGTHQLIIHRGSDGNTLLDNCGNVIPELQTIAFDYFIPQPILADSVGKLSCAPDSVKLYYPKKIKCSTISPSGSDFSVNGPTPVTVTGATGNCVNDLTDYVVIKFASPIYTKGNYNLAIQPGIDGSPIFDVCGQPLLPQSLSFTAADTVSALFTYTSKLGCQRDTLTFAHDGAHDVNNWNWVFNNSTPITTQTHTIIWPATSSNTVQLIVSNGVCKDTANSTVALNNEVKAIFSMTDFICPEDRLEVINNSEGLIDTWSWTYDVVGSSTLKDPPPFLFPTLNREAYYTVKLTVSNNTLNCSDSTKRTLTVLDHCLIAVPTAFTPNGDGLNDTFWPHNALKADNLIFKIYNRWGQLLFQSRTWRDRWDGKINGVLQPTGVYVWMLNYIHRDTKKQVFQKGTVTLIR
jgi:gliding motility-associated-like protein